MKKNKSGAHGEIESWLLFLIISLPIITLSCVTKEYAVTENYTEIEMRTEYKTESYTDIETIVTQIPSEEVISPIIKWGSPYLRMSGGLDYNCGKEDSRGFKDIWYSGYDITANRGSHIKIVFPEQLQREAREVEIYDFTNTGNIDAPPNPDLIGYGCTGCCLQSGGRFSRWLASANAKLIDARYLGGESSLHFNDLGASVIEFDRKGAKIIGVLIYGTKYSWNATMTTTLVSYDTNVEEKTVTKERQVPYQVPYEIEKQGTVMQTKRVPFWESIFNK